MDWKHVSPHDHMVLDDVTLILQVQIEEQIVEARIPGHLDISRHQSLQAKRNCKTILRLRLFLEDRMISELGTSHEFQ